ncbi:MAG: hypothetical protein AAF203_07225 [Pseudomonadota bacterium]
MGRLLLESSKVAAKHQVVLPSELMIFFKSMVTIEGISRSIDDDFDLLPFATQFAAELLKTKVSTKELFSDVSFQFKEWTSLIDHLPQELKTHMRKINQPDYAKSVEIRGLRSFQKTIFESGRFIFMGFVIGSLILSGSIALQVESSRTVYGFPLLTATLYGIAAILFVRFFLKNR